MNELLKFTGRPMVEVPDVPMIGYLEGEFGKDFIETYNKTVDEGLDNSKDLKVLSFEDNVVKGSNTYSSVLAADILRKSGLQLASPADIEAARKLREANPALGIDTRGCYVDCGVVFRSAEEPNAYHAKRLEPQIKKALKVRKINYPVVILSGGLELADGSEGLDLRLRSGAKPFVVPALKRNTNFRETDKKGMPLPDAKGNRRSYTIESGLSRLHLGGALVLDSYWRNLAVSNSGGRVVAVKK